MNRSKTLFHKHKQRYGAERLQRKMPKENSQPYDLKTIAASLKRQGLMAKAARKFKATTNSKHNLPVFDNRLQQDFSATALNQKWASGITYLWTEEGWLLVPFEYTLSMRQAVFEYIETDYNPVRLHSTNGFLSPIEFEAHFKQTLAS